VEHDATGEAGKRIMLFRYGVLGGVNALQVQGAHLVFKGYTGEHDTIIS
jgi:hypothetical protein